MLQSKFFTFLTIVTFLALTATVTMQTIEAMVLSLIQ